MFESLQENLRKALSLFGKQGKLTPEIVKSTLKEVRRALLSADVNFKAVSALVKNIEEKALTEKVLETLTPEQTIIKIVRDELISFLGSEPYEPDYRKFKRPLKIMLVGLQGSGKTTASAKLGVYLRKKFGMEKVLLVACDTVRPAAVLQLKTLADENQLNFSGSETGTAFDNALDAIRKSDDFDLLIFDTQGRLHIDEKMLDELKELYELVKPDIVFLVIDTMFGQEALNVAQEFHKTTPLTGIILSKLDGDSRGGAALSARFVTGVPVVYASTGEKVDDFELFYPERMVSRILGMGDVLTLIEKAEKELDLKKAQDAQKKLLDGKFDLNDYLEQLREVNKLGGIEYILEQLPADLKKNLGVVDEKMLKRTEAIILSMTPEERSRPEIIDGSRRARIAKGSGTTVQDVNQLLKSYYEMKKMFKSAKKLKKRRFGLKFPF